MNKTEATQVLEDHLRSFRSKNYTELVGMIDKEPVCLEFTAARGCWYQMEIQVFWDDKADGDVRVIGAIDDGGWRAFFPLSLDFIKRPDNTFVDE